VVIAAALVSAGQLLLVPYLSEKSALTAWLQGLSSTGHAATRSGEAAAKQLVAALSGDPNCLCEEGHRQGHGVCTVSSCSDKVVWLFSTDNFTDELQRHGVALVPWPMSLMDADLTHHLHMWTKDAARFWDSQTASDALLMNVSAAAGAPAGRVKDASDLGAWVKPLRESFRKAPSRKKYDILASGISDWRLEDAAATLSDAHHNGREVWPAVAVFPNALVHPDGVVESPVAVQDDRKPARPSRPFKRLPHTKRFTLKGCQVPSRRHLALQRARVSDKSEPAHYIRAASIANIIAGAYFHFVIETLTRITPLLPELRNGSGVAPGGQGLRLHIADGDLSSKFVKEYLAMLGVPATALTSGVMTAQTLLVPEATSCGGASTIQVHLLRRELWRSLSFSPSAQPAAAAAAAMAVVAAARNAPASPLPVGGGVLSDANALAGRPGLAMGVSRWGKAAAEAAANSSASAHGPPAANSSVQTTVHARAFAGAGSLASGADRNGSRVSVGGGGLVPRVGSNDPISATPPKNGCMLCNMRPLQPLAAPTPRPSNASSTPPPPAQCNMLVLKRETGSGTRTLSNHGLLMATVRAEAEAYGCSVTEHNGRGSLKQQLSAFATASVVIAVHGAGVSV